MDDNKITLSLISLGCDKNLVESERALGLLNTGAYAFAPSEEDADVIIINTCGFIQAAVDEAREHISQALELKSEGSAKAVIVTGCMAQRYKERILQEFPEIDKIVYNTTDIPAAVTEALGRTSETGVNTETSARILSTPGHYAYLKIAEGCDNHCAYCAIPLIKGPFKSRPIEELLAEAKTLAVGGVRELIIVAQDTSLYGTDIYGRKRLPELLRELSQITGVAWLRLMYCYPEHIDDALIDEMATNPKVCHYLDMPIQHCSGDVLRSMNRHTDAEGLRMLVSKLRGAMPDIILRTTVMTGFPGETREDFQSLLSFLNDMRFDRLGAFAYSREEGTPAFDFPNQVPAKTSLARRDRVMEQQSSVSAAKLNACKGKTLTVLIDGWDAENKMYYGRSYMDCPETDGLVFIEAPAKSLRIGEFTDILVTDALEYDLIGRVI